MSDALSQDEIDKLLTESEEEKFERKRAWILRNIKNIETLNFNLVDDTIIIDALMNIVKIMMTMKKMECIYDSL